MASAVAPNQSETLVGHPDEDGYIIMDTKDLKDNTWTKLVPGAKHCISGFVKDENNECVGEKHLFYTFIAKIFMNYSLVICNKTPCKQKAHV